MLYKQTNQPVHVILQVNSQSDYVPTPPLVVIHQQAKRYLPRGRGRSNQWRGGQRPGYGGGHHWPPQEGWGVLTQPHIAYITTDKLTTWLREWPYWRMQNVIAVKRPRKHAKGGLRIRARARVVEWGVIRLHSQLHTQSWSHPNHRGTYTPWYRPSGIAVLVCGLFACMQRFLL